MRKQTELDTLTDYQKCKSIFAAVSEGKDCELSYAELEALQDGGYIANLKRVSRNRWSFEWTDRLEAFVKASPAEQQKMISQDIKDSSP